jgi:hypothetical protein
MVSIEAVHVRNGRRAMCSICVSKKVEYIEGLMYPDVREV